MGKYLDNKTYSNLKRRLTIAMKKGPQAVIDECNHFVAVMDDGDYCWPDDWARWMRAKEDALYQLARDRGYVVE